MGACSPSAGSQGCPDNTISCRCRHDQAECSAVDATAGRCGSGRLRCSFRRQASGELEEEVATENEGSFQQWRERLSQREQREGSRDSCASSASGRTIDSNDMGRLFSEDTRDLTSRLHPGLTRQSLGSLPEGDAHSRHGRKSVKRVSMRVEQGSSHSRHASELDQELDKEDRELRKRRHRIVFGRSLSWLSTSPPAEPQEPQESPHLDDARPRPRLRFSQIVAGAGRESTPERTPEVVSTALRSGLPERDRERENAVRPNQPPRSRSRQNLLAVLEDFPELPTFGTELENAVRPNRPPRSRSQHDLLPTSVDLPELERGRERENAVRPSRPPRSKSQQHLLATFEDFPDPGEHVREPEKAERPKRPARSKSQQHLLATLERVPSQRLQLIIENPQSIDVNYDVHQDHLLGEGSYGKVCKAVVSGTRAARATKYILKERVIRKLQRLKAEITISKMVDHPNLIKLYEIFENPSHIILVMELCSGGTLQSRLSSGIPEATAAIVMLQLLSGAHYMHASQICHRDLKPQNILVTSRGCLEHNTFKITDFGMSCILVAGQMLKAEVGTTSYMAPQVFKKSYDEKCDIWSLGVVLYFLLAGQLPFPGKDREEKEKAIASGRYFLKASIWSDTSGNLLRLLQAMLRKNQQKRLSAHAALQHPWFEKMASPNRLPVGQIGSLIRKMRDFRSLNKFKKAAFHLIVSMLTDEQIRRPREVFMWLDADKDGLLSEEDLKLRLESVTGHAFGTHPQDACVLNFYYTEFLAATFDRDHIEDETCRAAFSIFDQDGGGTITISELADERSPLGHLSAEEIARLVTEMDHNGDGEVDFPEFLVMMRGDRGGRSPQSPKLPSLRRGRSGEASARSRETSPRFGRAKSGLATSSAGRSISPRLRGRAAPRADSRQRSPGHSPAPTSSAAVQGHNPPRSGAQAAADGQA